MIAFPCAKGGLREGGGLEPDFPLRPYLLATRFRRRMPPSRPWPPVIAEDTHDLLILLAEVKLSGRKQPLDDHVVPLDPLATRWPSPPGRSSRLAACRPWSMPFASSMQTLCPSSKRTESARAACPSPVAEIQRIDIHTGGKRRRSFGGCILLAQGNEVILRVDPGHSGHIALCVGPQLEMIGAAVGINDEVCD